MKAGLKHGALHQLPDNWQWVRLGEVHKIVTGTTPPRKASCYYGGQIPFVKPQDLDQGANLLQAEESLSDEGAAQAVLVPAGSTLLACIGSVGKSAFARVPVTTNQQINSLIPDERVVPKYTYYYMLSPLFQKVLQERISITTIAIVNKSKLSDIPFPLPPKETQQQIVEWIEQSLGKLQQIEQFIAEGVAALTKCRAALLNEWFGTGLSGLPADWRLVPFKELVRESKNGLTRSHDEQAPDLPYGYFKMNNITPSGEMDLTELTRVDANEQEVRQYRLKDGDLLINTRNSWELVGKNTVFSGEHPDPVLFNNNLLRIRFHEYVNPWFISCFLRSAVGQAQLNRIKYATTNVAAIYAKHLHQLLIPVPPLNVQNGIVAEFQAVVHQEKQVFANIPQEADLASLRESILAQAFQGEKNKMVTSW